MALDLDRLAALEAEATPGPWQWVDPDTDLPCLPDAPCATGDHDRHVYRFSLRTVARFPTDYVGPLPKFVIHLAEEFSEHEQSDGSWTHPDAQLITEARNALPELISASRRAVELEAENERLRELVEKLTVCVQMGGPSNITMRWCAAQQLHSIELTDLFMAIIHGESDDDA